MELVVNTCSYLKSHVTRSFHRFMLQEEAEHWIEGILAWRDFYLMRVDGLDFQLTGMAAAELV